MSQIMLTVALPLVLAWVMYCVGLTLSTADFKRITKQPLHIIGGLLAQLIGLPLLAFGIISVFSLPTPIAVGLWLLALAPGGASSNAITHLSKGDTALSISMTAISSLIIPFSIPLLLPLLLTETQFNMPIKMAVLQLSLVTIFPVCLGMFMKSNIQTRGFLRFMRFAERSSLWALGFTVAITLAANAHVFSALFSNAALASILLCISGMILGLVVAKLCKGNKRLVKTFAIEVGIQNAGTAIFVAVVLLQRPEFALTPLLYGVLMNIPAFLIIAKSKHEIAVDLPVR